MHGFRYSPAMRNPAVLPCSLLCLAAALLGGGCDTISSDMSQFTQSFSPPTPTQAAMWAADPNDRENARRGTILLANAPWGGATPYLRMYRLYAEDSLDPLVRAAAIQALGRHGAPEEAVLVAKSLPSPFRQVRLAAAKALQRLHDPAVADSMWTRMIDPNEDSDVRAEIAIALGQYPTPAVFNALVAALSQRDLAVNVAAVDSLRCITGQNFGIDENAWITYAASCTANNKDSLLETPNFVYPTFVRDLDMWDHLMFWSPTVFESPDVPIGMKQIGGRRTNDGSRNDVAPDGTPAATPGLEQSTPMPATTGTNK